jgi:hypothetical protein
MKRSTNKSPVHPSWLPIIEDVHRQLPAIQREFKKGGAHAFSRVNKGKQKRVYVRKRRA